MRPSLTSAPGELSPARARAKSPAGRPSCLFSQPRPSPPSRASTLPSLRRRNAIHDQRTSLSLRCWSCRLLPLQAGPWLLSYEPTATFVCVFDGLGEGIRGARLSLRASGPQPSTHHLRAFGNAHLPPMGPNQTTSLLPSSLNCAWSGSNTWKMRS